MNKEKEQLFQKEFPPLSPEKWMEKVTADLKGADFERKLVWKTNEGFAVQPMYTGKDLDGLEYLQSFPGEFPYVRGNKKKENHWHVRQNIRVKDYTMANKKALDILMKGVDSLGFIIEDPETVSEENFTLLFKNIFIASIEVVIDAGGKTLEAVEAFKAVMQNNNRDLTKVTGGLEVDPLGRLLVNGKLCTSIDNAMDYAVKLFEQTAHLPGFRPLSINGQHFANAGATAVQELAYTLSVAAEYLDRLSDKGVNVNTLATGFRFNFSVGSNYFMEIAKFRAARLLWAHMTQAYKVTGIEVSKMVIHAATSRWNKTIYDPYVNMLRTQTEAMSASLGGVDSLTVEPFDTVFGEPNEFSERIARNQQLLLKEEAHFDKVIDPASGSYYIENLTHSIVNATWELFLSLEEKGGFLENLKAGNIQKDIKEGVIRRKKNINRRKESFLGTTQFPNATEKLNEKVDLNKALPEKKEEVYEYEPLDLQRGPVDYERLRLKVERAAKKPIVFLLPVGHPAMRTARAQFSSAFFATAGYEILDNPGFNSLEEGLAEALKAKADIVVLCSSDEEYTELAPSLHKQLNGKAIPVIAGAPESMEELKKQGLKHFIHVRSVILDELENFNNLLNIS